MGLVYKEIEKRTLYSLLAKPIRRWQFLVGKYAGLLLTLGVNTAFMTLGLAAAFFYVGGTSGASRCADFGCDLFHPARIRAGHGAGAFFFVLLEPDAFHAVYAGDLHYRRLRERHSRGRRIHAKSSGSVAHPRNLLSWFRIFTTSTPLPRLATAMRFRSRWFGRTRSTPRCTPRYCCSRRQPYFPGEI